MTHDHGQCARNGRVDDREVGMAKPGTTDSNQNFIVVGALEVYLLHAEGATFSVGLRCSSLKQDSGFHLHGGATSSVSQ